MCELVLESPNLSLSNGALKVYGEFHQNGEIPLF